MKKIFSRELGEQGAAETGFLVAMSVLVSGFAGYAIGASMMAKESLSGKEITELQEQNAQLTSMVASQFPSETDLLVSPGADTFSFTATNKEGKLVTCSAPFEAKGSDVTKIGTISCVQTIKLSK